MRLRGEDKFERERTIIDRQVQHVVRLVDDLLDVSRITRGKIEIRKENVELSVIIGKAVEMASPLLEQRSQNLKVSVPHTGLAVLADQGRLSQAIANVLINAAKFTEPRGHISVDAEAEGTFVVIRIRDSGAGIAPETLPFIFDLFVQHTPSLDRARGGLGIGLTVVRSLVELHGGSVSAHSAGPGKGSEFVLRLPRASDASTAREASPAAPDRQRKRARQGLRVLVVDDNPDAASLLAEALDMHGSARWLRTTGRRHSRRSDFAPELALLDIGLPVMDGYELARRLRALTAPVPTWWQSRATGKNPPCALAQGGLRRAHREACRPRCSPGGPGSPGGRPRRPREFGAPLGPRHRRRDRRAAAQHRPAARGPHGWREEALASLRRACGRRASE